MARAHKTFVCSACGATAPKWQGQCPACGAWNSLEPSVVAPQSPASNGAAPPVRRLADVGTESVSRAATGMTGLDRTLGGGLVPGSVVLLGGDPGIGKSTLLLQAATPD